MKRIVQREISGCDQCGKDIDYPTRCLICGSEFCYECAETEGTKFRHGVHFSGSGDGYYCHACQQLETVKAEPLFQAYRTIVGLRNEEFGFWEDFKARCDKAEKLVDRLYNDKDRIVKED